MFTPLKFISKWRNLAEARDGSGIAGLSAPELNEEAVRAVLASASWLIDYPGDELLARLPLIRELLDTADLPQRVRAGLLETVAHLESGDVFEVRSEYVETFDTRRRGCLFLTYFANGDTRRRGRALLEIKQTYREAGLDMDDSQLPDHLTCVLEFAAGHDLARGLGILLANRAGIELLRLGLTEAGSPWAGTVAAVCSTLPPLDGDDIHAVQRLAADGPAEETVGLDGLGGYGDAPPMSPPPAGPCGPAGAPGGASTFIPLAEVKGNLR